MREQGHKSRAYLVELLQEDVGLHLVEAAALLVSFNVHLGTLDGILPETLSTVLVVVPKGVEEPASRR